VGKTPVRVQIPPTAPTAGFKIGMGYTAKDLIKVIAMNVVCLRSDFRPTQEIEEVLEEVKGIESPRLSGPGQGSVDDPRRPYGSVARGKPS
jgi:hypothetical protein